MVRLTSVCKSFGGQKLFHNADWFVERRDRVALIGPNGSGKSTLLKMIAGLEGVEQGTLEMPRNTGVGYLAQRGFLLGEGTVREEAREAFREALLLQEESRAIEARLGRSSEGDADLPRLTQRHGEIHERLAILGAHQIERQIHQVLSGLGFNETDFDSPVAELSGGWQMRVALARILLERPQLLLLDEPTNHLDLEAREWLEGYLHGYPYAFLIVSHDRHFLDRTVRRVTEIVDRRLENYAGNYSFYEREREKRFTLRLKAYEQQQQEIRRLQQFIARNRANKKMASRTHSRMLVLEKMERLAPPQARHRSIRIRYPECPHSGKVVLEMRRLVKCYGEKRVLDGVDLQVLRGARVALVGANGAGKSTLMRLMAGREAPDAGERIPGYRIESAFFAQDEGARFERRKSVYATVEELAPTDFVPQVRSLLGAFLFSGDAVEKPTGALSGGELNRLALACLMVRPSNLLLLDEPTNHLDIPAKDALLHSLKAYPGTVVFVSHDRHFLDHLAMHVVEVGGGKVREYPGTYAGYLWHRRQGGRGGVDPAAAVPGGRDGAAVAPGERSGTRQRREGAQGGTPAAGGDAGSGGKSRRAGGSRRQGRRARRLNELEGEIHALEQRKERFALALGNPDLYADPEKARFYAREIGEIEARLESLYHDWAALQDAAG
ncbi:MAG: ABC-F family ATP-binding cassette domain-containing protein [Candidatus Eisenbacteria sp.]|nr:ABC-F family ATP-binding cassette domain-containing protein [Candidatus Eisenbacteria bacterium]